MKYVTLSLCCVFIAISSDKVQADDGSKPASAPFKLLPSRHILVKVTINGEGPYNFIFDTGAPINLLSSRVAKDAKIKGGGGGMFSLFGGLNQTTVKSIGMAGVSVADVPVVVMDHPTVQTISEVFEKEYGKIDGIVGFPFFARYRMAIDYQAKELTFQPSGFKPGDYLKEITNSLMSATENDGKPTVEPSQGLWGFSIAEPAKNDQPGMIVSKVYGQSRAEAGGLRVGDRIVTFGKRWITSEADLVRATSQINPRKKTAIEIVRDGKTLMLDIAPAVGY